MSQYKPIDFYVSAGFGGNTQQPFVQVLIEAADFVTKMSPGEARGLALNLLECADAAESDAFLITFLRQRVAASDEAIAQVLEDFRQWRLKQAP
jgi:hypothetical protein